jgi:hypothetical protein
MKQKAQPSTPVPTSAALDRLRAVGGAQDVVGPEA